MKILSLFSGVGGLDRAVGHPSLLCERDPYARRVLARHWPGVECAEDVRDVGDVGADVVIGGPPCQAASHAGKRAGKADDRWLWPEAIRVVGANRPRWAFFENVAGLPTLDNGEPFAEILRDLDRLGYAVRWDHAEAASAGAPHRRDRVWLLCVRHDDWTAPTLAASVQQGLFGSAPPVEWSRAGWYARGRWGVEAARWGKVAGGEAWPTPASADGERASESYCRGNPTLLGSARAAMWPTPKSSDNNGTREYDGKRGLGLNDYADRLGRAYSAWDAWFAEAAQRGGSWREYADAHGHPADGVHPDGSPRLTAPVPLPAWARADIVGWPTPSAQDDDRGTDGDRAGGPPLTGAVKAAMWPTPGAADGKDVKAHTGGNPSLAGAAGQWDHKGARVGLLNPDFAEWLMGWPRGWTLPDGPSLAGAVAPGWGGDLVLYNGRPAPRDVPLLTTEREHRRPRLRCVGNGVVTACASMVLADLASGLLDVRGAA